MEIQLIPESTDYTTSPIKILGPMIYNTDYYDFSQGYSKHQGETVAFKLTPEGLVANKYNLI